MLSSDVLLPESIIIGMRRTQIAALFGTAILTVLPATQFAGVMTPVSSLSGGRANYGSGLSDDIL